MNPNTFQILAGVLRYAPGPIRGAAFGAPWELQPLVDLGILVAKGHIDSITCVECDEGHAAPIDQNGGKLIGICDRLGCDFEIEEDVTAYEVSTSALIDWIAGALSTKDRPRQLNGGRDLWALGPIKEQAHAIAIYVLPLIVDYQHLSDTGDAIRGRSHANRDGAALIHCGSLECSSSASPSGLVVIRLQDIANISSGGNFAIETDRLFELTVPNWKQKPAARGRPAITRDALMPIIKELDDNGKLEGGLRAAANQAIKEFTLRNPEIKEIPGLTGAKAAVKMFREEEASGRCA